MTEPDARWQRLIREHSERKAEVIRQEQAKLPPPEPPPQGWRAFLDRHWRMLVLAPFILFMFFVLLIKHGIFEWRLLAMLLVCGGVIASTEWFHREVQRLLERREARTDQA